MLTGTFPASTPARRFALLDVDEAANLRLLWCPAYDACLDVAARAGWVSWTCEACARSGMHAAAGPDEEVPRTEAPTPPPLAVIQ